MEKNTINALNSKILGYDEITHKILQTLSPHISHLLSYKHTHTHTVYSVQHYKNFTKTVLYIIFTHKKFIKRVKGGCMQAFS
jgi:hypothetical protein